MNQKKIFKQYLSKQTDDVKKQINSFFNALKSRLFLISKDKKMLVKDFQRAFVEYDKMGVSNEKVFELLDLTNLGGFYSRPSSLWLPLDDVAKSYSQWIDRKSMAVFRIAAYVKEKVKPEFLQMALNFTIKRFPEYAMCIKRGFFWHYLDSIRRRFPIEKEGPLPVQRIHLTFTGSKAFRVLYYENRISVEFFHSMADGTGATEFLKCLLSCYLKLLNKTIGDSPLVINHNSDIDREEFENAFLKVKRNGKVSGYTGKKALQLSGKLTLEKPCRVLHFKMPADQLVALAKKYEVSVTAFIASKILNACKYSIDQIDGDVDISIPVNMRKFYPSKTLRNFSLFCHVRKPIEDIEDTPHFIKNVYAHLKDESKKENMSEMLSSTASMFHKIRFVPLPLKQPVTKTLYKVFGDRIITTALSNLGKIELPDDISSEIISMDFVLGTADFNRANFSLITVNNVATLSIAKNTKDPSIEEKLFEILSKEGLPIEVEGSELYGH